MKWTSILATVAATVALTYSATAQNVSVKLWRLDCGGVNVKDLNAFSDSFQYTGQSRTLTASCYLIQHGDAYMLWDVGLPKALQNAPQDANAPLAPSFKTTVVEQLMTLNVTADMIGLVGISHNHFDHTGQASDFPKATLLIGKADLAEFKNNPPPFADPSTVTPWLTGGSKVEEIVGDKDVFGDGSVTILTTPGHTHGSQSLLVRLNKTGPVILSGDTVHFEEQFANDGVPPFNVDRSQSLASMDRLEDMAANLNATLIVQHDANDIGKLPTFPQAAE